MSLERLVLRLKNRLRGNPDEVVVEPTNYCNLRCPTCAADRSHMKDELGFMDVAEFESLVQELKGRVYKILFSGRGEPTMHPQIFDLIEACTRNGIYIYMNTNGTLLNSPGMADSLVEAGLKRINFAVDGLTQETYEKVRVGGKLSDVMGAIEELIMAKERHGVTYPKIDINLIATGYNVSEIQRIGELPKKVPIDKICINLVCIPDWYGTLDVEAQKRMVDAYVPRSGPNRYSGYALQKPGKRCGDYKRAHIRWNGELQRCFFDNLQTPELGNVFNNGFFHVWNSAPTREVKDDVRHKQFPMCSKCPQTFSYGRTIVYRA